MRKIAFLFASMFVLLNANAQQAVTKIKLSGFNVTLVPSTEFSSSYDTSKPIKEELNKNSYTLEATNVKGKKNRELVTINYVNIESLELINCELIINNPLSLVKLALTLDKSSTVNLVLNAKELKAKVKDNSQLGLEGDIKKNKIEIEKESILNSYALISDNFSLSANSHSVVQVHVNAKDADLSAKKSKLTMGGQAKKLKAKASSESQIDATGMQVEKAEIEVKESSSIKVKPTDELKSKISN